MSTTTDNTRKRPHNETTTTFQLDNSHQNQDGASNNGSGNNNGGIGGTNNAQENKRRQILQYNKNWGLRELLVECGLVEFSMNEERDGTFLLFLYYLVFVLVVVCLKGRGINYMIMRCGVEFNQRGGLFRYCLCTLFCYTFRTFYTNSFSIPFPCTFLY